ncbi:M23 family metallopeptidase [Modestobacter excelsi]|uniref:M23 family metallopeptidase n=1 Tax=Modestobacter excelsi TaxID=2213161 RepID=UPI00110D18BA|nr:M23 family metallopeptidase [Modestobacter excelsi]
MGRTRSEDGLAAVLDAGPASAEFVAPDGAWDWDAAWAASQADEDDEPDGDVAGIEARGAAVEALPTSTDDAPSEGDAAEPAPLDEPAEDVRPSRRRRTVTVPATLRRPPGRRAPVLLAAAVLGAVLTGVLGGLGGFGSDAGAPITSGQDYGLGVSDSSFSGGVDDAAGARGEISQAEAQARLSEIAASRAAREPDFVVPTDGRLTTCFCQRWGTMHWGIDLAAPLGTPIYAAADGVVLRAGPATGYGNAVYIQDADGNVEIYGHMKYYDVQAGDVVSAGDQIAKVGSQGQSTGPHLHFEIHVGGMNGKPTDPQDWLAERGLSVD